LALRAGALVLAAGLGLLQACALPPPAERTAAVVQLAAASGWTPQRLTAGTFDLHAFVPAAHEAHASERLTIYLEGDGLAWLNPTTPALSPTPLDPIGLRLAMAHTGGRVAYLGRPCQYIQGDAVRGCHPRYWGSHRFAPEVLDAMDQTVQQIKQRLGAAELVLVGYSGGAALAALLAGRRSDVVAWVSVAGVLDTDAWTQSLGISALHGSLNPAAFVPQSTAVPQWHFIGSEDRVVAPVVLQRFLDAQARLRLPGAATPTVQQLPAFDHGCCWVQEWPRLSRLFSQPDTFCKPGQAPANPVSDKNR
jgi:hypothetical protein